MLLYYFLVSLLPFARHPFWGQFAGGMTMFKYLGGACLFVALVYLAVRRSSPRLFATSQARWFAGFIVIAHLSYFLEGAQFSLQFNQLISYISFFLFFLITKVLLDTVERFRWTVLVAVGAVAWATLYIVREYQKYPGMRPGWVSGDANYYAASGLLVLPVAYCLYRGSGPAWERRFGLGCLLVILAGTMLAASRGGLLGLVVSFAYVTLRLRRRKGELVFVGVILGILIMLSPTSPLRRLTNPSASDQDSAEARKVLWRAGVQMVKDDPLTGVGLGNFKSMLNVYVTDPEDRKWITVQGEQGELTSSLAHSTYIELAAEMGLPALICFIAMLYCSHRGLVKVRRRAQRSGQRFLADVAAGIQGGFLGFVVCAFFITAQYQKVFWLMVFLSTCLPAFVRSPAETKASPGKPRVVAAPAA